MSHTSVLLHEAIEGLAIEPGDIFVDGTLGDGGHSSEVLARVSDIKVIGIDRDQDMIDRATLRFAKEIADGKVFVKQGNFRDAQKILSSFGFETANRFLFDVGLNSRQIEESGRGFSFKTDEPLVMTFEKNAAGVTARDVVNEWQEQTLIDILTGFGEERHAKRIAKSIVTAREQKPIETTHELVEIIKKSTPFYYHHGKIHPATRTFQAIRIAVNDELEAIREGLKNSWDALAPSGRIAVISFHSLEDRIVKQYFNELKEKGIGKVLTKKPLTASEEEIKENPRSRSAKLRIIEKVSS